MKHALLTVIALGSIGIAYFFYKKNNSLLVTTQVLSEQVVSKEEKKETDIKVEPDIFVATHISTPESVKALYMTSYVAGTKKMRDSILDIARETEINALVVDIKDYTGRISYLPTKPELIAIGSSENRIPDIRGFIKRLHDDGLYVIGRVAVFQDPFLVDALPHLAVKKSSNKESVWRDRKGIPWLDAGSEEVWNYTLLIAHDAYEQGFDEINFDYVRFPSDGDMRDIFYPVSEGMVKHEIMRSFFEHIGTDLKNNGIPSSVDLFGMTATNTDDLGIGQLLEDALPYFDYVAPMVYPSHFPATWNGLASPAKEPYKVIYATMQKAGDRAEVLGLSRNKIRPWLQDFNLGAVYTADMVREQITATYDAGLNSWMIWDASNTYTKNALILDKETVEESQNNDILLLQE